MSEWVRSCTHCVGSIWLTVFIGHDFGVTYSAEVVGSPIRVSGCWSI